MALLRNHQLPPSREEATGSAPKDGWQEIWRARFPSRLCLSGLKGASCQVPFQGWGHFHQRQQCLPSRFRHRKGWAEDVVRVGSTARSPWGTKLFLSKWEMGLYHHRSGRKGIQNKPFRSRVSARGTRMLGFMYRLWIPQTKATAENKSSLPPSPHPNWFIVSKCLLVLRKYAIKQEMRKYPLLPEGRGRNHIPVETGNQLIRIQAFLRETTAPFSRHRVVQSLVPLRLQSLPR